MDPFFHTGLSISDSLKTVRKSVLIYETIIISLRTYYVHRDEAIEVLSSILWGYTSQDCEKITNLLTPD